MNMLAYPLYQWFAECTRPARAWAAFMRAAMSFWPPSTAIAPGRALDAWCELNLKVGS